MSKQSIIDFMEATGNYPDPDAKMWKKKQLLMSTIERLLEEVNETGDAVVMDDWVEVLDGVVDCYFVLTQLLITLQEYGFDVQGAIEDVCLNNELKYSSNMEYMTKEKARYDVEKEVGMVRMEGNMLANEWVYCLKRNSDDKVMKPLDHPKVKLSEYVPPLYKKKVKED